MKIWFVCMAGVGSLDDLKELWEPIRAQFDGIIVTLHGQSTDPEALYLESVKGAGRIIYLPYSQRHNFSRNAYLYCGPIQDGDWVMQADTLERPSAHFCKHHMRPLIHEVSQQGINLLYYYGKPFLFEYHESLEYSGSPHEGLNRRDGRARGIEINQRWPNESDVRLNVRPLKRLDPYGWVWHYARYMLMPWGSNHCLLGLENRGDPRVLFGPREQRRLEFREEIRKRGYPITLQGLKDLLSEPLDDKMKSFLNAEKVWQDVYRLHVLGDKTVRDEHEWISMIKIP